MPKSDQTSARTCIVTRQSASPDALIRFVIAPDGAVVADLRRRLPGRGVWVTASADMVRTAEKKKLFARGFGEPVKVEPGLAERVGDLLAMAAIGALSLARKAGEVVSGFAKVESALRSDPVVALLHAAEAAPDGSAKLDAAMRRRFGAAGLPVIRCFTGTQLDLAFGRSNVIHAALLAGPASGNVLARVDALIRYLGGNGDETVAARPMSSVSELSAGT
ncbi:MAG: RNA-binding protein [Bauldia sp.]